MTVAVACATASLASAASLLAPVAADAANAATTNAAVDQAQRKLDALGVQADQAVEAYNAAQTAYATAAGRVKAQHAALATVQRRLDAARISVQSYASEAYKQGGNSAALTMISSDPSQLAAKAATLQHVDNYQAASLTTVINDERAVASAQAAAQQSLAAQKAALAQMSARRAAVQKIIGVQQSLLTKLQGQAAAQAAAAATAQAARQRQLVAAAAARTQRASRSQSRVALPALQAAPRQAAHAAAPVAMAPPAARGSVNAVLAYAYAQLGKPYHWGGAGPGSYDCSGLAMRAWGAAGVQLSHSAAAQQHSGTPVSLSALQPGDLVFWGRPAYHVGIYVGGGRILDAPHTGTVVQIQAIWGSPSSAVRP